MTRPKTLASLVCGSLLVATLAGLDDAPARHAPPTPPKATLPEGYARLFNGTDLSGWVNANCWPGTFSARDGMIFCDGKPTGFLRTDRMYENFVLEFDWLHEEKEGNAGLFVWADPIPSSAQNMFPRAIEVQIMLTPDRLDKEGRLLYTGQGDVFSIWGAKMTPLRPHPAGWERTLPSERVTKGAGEWNHYKVTCDKGDLTLEINGKAVSGARNVTPRKGYICLESEGSPIWFANLMVRELPPAQPPLEANDIAMDGAGLVRLFDGRTLDGWREDPAKAGHWTVEDGVLKYDGKGESLWTTKDYRDFELIVDWRWTKEHQGKMLRPRIAPDGSEQKGPDGKVEMVEVDERDSGIYLRGSTKSQINMWMWPCGSGEIYGYRTDSQMPAAVRAAATPKANADKPVGQWNRFVIRVQGTTVNVDLNGVRVIENASLPAMPETGPIGLQHHMSPIEFENIYLRPLGK
jgi:hypothetical protein